jgi:hypothetical protein
MDFLYRISKTGIYEKNTLSYNRVQPGGAGGDAGAGIYDEVALHHP